ncbi:MAG: hypothetical protein PVF37_23110 [Desulfobacterales bacterium]|jgi:hypothetical protein
MNSQAHLDEMDPTDNNETVRMTTPLKLAVTLKNRKKVAKMGMTISLGSLVLSGLMHFKGHKSLHTWSGIALLGFSYWHHRLNKKKSV